MKRRFTEVLAGILYAAVFVGLLILQTQTMQGGLNKVTANLATLVLVSPIFFVLKFCLKVKMQQDAKTLDGEEDMQIPELVREAFYVQAEQMNLSGREQEVGWLIYCGYTNLQIAEELYISETTVKKHAGHIYEKTQTSGRKEFREKINKSIKNN